MRRTEDEHHQGLEVRRRERRRAAAALAVGVVAALAVLLSLSWLVVPGWLPSGPLRVATPISPPDKAVAPVPPGPGTRRVGHGGGGESTMTRGARDVAPTVSEPQGARPSAPEGTASQPAPRLPAAPEATLSQGERPEPESTTPRLSTAAGPVDREVTAQVQVEPLADGFTSYTVRLHERDGRPVAGATVSIRGRRADGVLEEAALEAEAEAGLYRAVVRVAFTEARLRIASVGRIQEIPLPDSPG